jgi:hypothetical protein
MKDSMTAETNADHSYRAAYIVGGIFLLGFILVTWAVVNDAHHRAELEQVVPQVVAAPSPTPGNQ